MKMKRGAALYVSYVLVFVLYGNMVQGQAVVRQNDDILPPGRTAVAFINFDNKGFLINGKRTFIYSGSIHYPRVPQQYWHDVLLKLKRSGFNTVETYIFWNFHEAVEGKYDFESPEHDFGAFLDEAKRVGLYAIVRVGPYVCAEWENGGYPTWLLQKPGIEIRTNNSPLYFEEITKWYNRVLPIVAARQINKGGNVILVQLENEHPADNWKHWGTDMYGKYFQLLLDLAHHNGIEVPMFFSGLNHGHDPAPSEVIDPATRKSPWMSTELWTTWFDLYGCSAADLVKGVRHPWRVLAQGGNGLNLYMYQGGSTFGYYNFNDERKHGSWGEKGGTCYDYGTLIGQTGDVRLLDLRLKGLGYFARSFSEILSGGDNVSSAYAGYVRGLPVTARRSPAGTLVFLDNAHGDTVVGLPGSVRMHLAGGEIVGLVRDVTLAPGVRIESADTRILGIARDSGVRTIVCYGEPGDTGRIAFSASFGAAKMGSGERAWSDTDGRTISFIFQRGKITEKLLLFGKLRVRVLVMDKDGADRTWIVDAGMGMGAGQKVITGASYLGEWQVDGTGKVRAVVDVPLTVGMRDSLCVFGEKVKSLRLRSSPETLPDSVLGLGKWRMYRNMDVLASGYDDQRWFALRGDSCPQMGQDGSGSPYAWYRAVIDAPHDIDTLTFLHIGDRARFFVDGRLQVDYDMRRDSSLSIALHIPAGKHVVAVFTAYSGRDKFAGFIGSPQKTELRKGMTGAPMPSVQWRMRGVDIDWFDSNKLVPVGQDRGGAPNGGQKNGAPDGVKPKGLENERMPAGLKDDGVPAWYCTRFDVGKNLSEGYVYRLTAAGLSRGSVWLNGHNVGKYPEIIRDCPGLWLPSAWMKPNGNELIIYDEQGKLPTNVTIGLEKDASRYRAVFSDR